MTEKEIWWSAYLAALAGGRVNSEAKQMADIALGHYRGEWGGD